MGKGPIDEDRQKELPMDLTDLTAITKKLFDEPGEITAEKVERLLAKDPNASNRLKKKYGIKEPTRIPLPSWKTIIIVIVVVWMTAVAVNYANM